MSTARSIVLLTLTLVGSGCAASLSRRPAAPVTCEDPASTIYAEAALSDAHGDPEAAVKGHLEVLRKCASSCEDPEIATASAMALIALRDRAIDVEGRVEVLRNDLGQKLLNLPAEARFQIGNLIAGRLVRHGKREAAQQEYRAMGCVLHWSAAGPFGPRPFFAWDNLSSSRPTETWPTSFDLGPARGIAPPREIVADTCTVVLKDEGRGRSGAYAARTTVAVDRATDALVRVQSSSSMRVLFGGTTVFEKDTRRHAEPTAGWALVRLHPGTTEIVVEIVSHNSAGASFSLALQSMNGKSKFVFQNPEGLANERADAVTVPQGTQIPICISSRMARLSAALFNDDFETARDLSQWLIEQGGEARVWGTLGAAEILEADPDLPGEAGFEAARDLYEEALTLDRRLFRATRRLASRSTDEGRIQDALRSLRSAIELSPREPELRIQLLEILAQQGWKAELTTQAAQLERLLPGSCKSLTWQHYAATQGQRHQQALELAKAISRCDASSTLLAQAWEDRGEWDRALAERTRLADLPDAGVVATSNVAAVLAASDNPSRARLLLQAALDKSPGFDAQATLQLASYALSEADETGASETLRSGQHRAPQPNLELLQAEALLAREPLLASLRIDGAEAIRRYREQKPDYATASVLVLDRMVQSVAENGAATVIVHTITAVRSDEAIESLGEVEIPAGAKVLHLRTFKPDGRYLEPDEVAFKQTLSLPELEIGDFIEVEYVIVQPPSTIVPGGFDTGRFYFCDFESAFHQSELIVITPQEMPILEDPRGACPAAQTDIRGGLRISTYRMRGTTPATEEPLAPLAREYLPSIRVLAAATMSDLLEDMRESLSELDRPTRMLTMALREILDGIPPDAHRARREAIYYWVLEHIDNQGGVFDPANHILLRRQGSRPRLFAVLCRLAGYEAHLGMVRSGLADATPDAAPSYDLYDRLAVLVPEDGWICLDHRGVPYGFLPPAMRRRPSVTVDTQVFGTTQDGTVPREQRRISMSVTFAGNGDATVLVREELTGLLASSWREDLRVMAKEDRLRQFQEGYLSDTIPGATLSSLAIEGENSWEAPLVIVYEAHVAGLATVRGVDLHAKLPMGISLTESAAGTAKRTTSLVLDMHTAKSLKVDIAVPPTYTAKLERPSTEREAGGTFGQVRAFATNNGNMLIAGYEASLDIDRVEPRQYEAFVDFSRKIDLMTNIEVLISPTRSH